MVTNDIILYSTDCPKCNVLKRKLDEKSVSYTENHSVEEMLSLGVMSVPVLRVNGELMNFTEAVTWANAQ